ncbi:MAG TPA: RNase adapter RapZ [Saprospiraceae bacterium]|nr:RNase adapter RapZ [Saprospiraceae bacterium]HQW56413.1 RNase adapter RapZ [Saprospiraceae bacterium]
MQVEKLTVHINSFSYKYSPLPIDEDHGLGFVFDLRGIENPGRIEKFKRQSGLDSDVINYLTEKSRINEYLDHTRALADITLETFLSRGFTTLNINFGCTGGQHRSVYAAVQMGEYISNNYPVRVIVSHLNKNNWFS